MTIKKPAWANANFIKILALITMTIDHIGWIIFGGHKALNIIGRISFPLFAFMIAEGSHYTKHRYKRLLSILVIGVICQIVFFVVEQSLDLNIFITFGMSITLITILQLAEEKKDYLLYILFGILSAVFFFFSEILPHKINFYRYGVQYGAVGVFLSVVVYVLKNRWLKLIAVAIMMLAFALSGNNPIYYWAPLAVIPLMLYNGQRGKWNIKYLFYLYFPLHFVVIYGIGLLI